MPFDTTNVAAEVGQQPQTNAFQTIAQLAAARNALNQNKMFQAQQAAGRDFQGSINPDGSFDNNRFMATVAGDPGAALAAQDAATSGANLFHIGLANTGQQISNQTNQQGLQAKQYGALQTILAQTPDDAHVADAINQATAAGIITPEFAANVAGGSVQGLDAASLHQLRQQAIMSAGNTSELKANIGDTSVVNTGGNLQTVLTKTGPGGATVTPATGNAAAIPLTLSPAEKAAPVPVVGPGGVETRHVASEFVNPDGTPIAGAAPPVIANPYATAAASAVGASMSGAANYVGQDGAQRQIARAAFVNPNGTFKPNVTDADGNPITDASGALKIALSPNDAAQLATTATNQADRAATLQSAFEGSPQRMALIQDMRATQGDFRSGPGAAKWAGIVTEANRVLGTKYDTTPASAEQVFGKIAEQLSATQRDTLGLPATNAGNQAAQLASPNTTYSPEANMQVLAQLAGNEKLLQTKTQAWNAYQKLGNGATYNGFVSNFNQKVDPRAFWEPYMTPQQMQTMTKAMSPTELQTYQQRKNYTGKLAAKVGVDGY